MKRFLSLLALLIVIHIPYACMEDECSDFTPLEARIKKVESSIGSLESDSFIDVQSTDFSVAAISLEITEMDFKEISEIRRVKYSSVFTSKAFACSPPLPELAYEIIDITISGTSSIFINDQEIQPNESLNSVFKVTNHNNIHFDEFVKTLNDNKWLFSFVGDQFTIALLQQPDQPIDQALTIKFEFSDNTSIEVLTDTFKVD